MSMPMPMPAYKNQSETYNMPILSMMKMSFYWGKDVVVLFSGWPGDGRLGMYIVALVVVFFLAVAAETLAAVPRWKRLRPVVGAAVHAGVYGVRVGVGYLVMLSVMSFNVGVFVAAVAGHVAGSFGVEYRALSKVAGAVDSQF